MLASREYREGYQVEKPKFKEVLKQLDAAVADTLVHFDQLDPSDLPTLLKSFALLKDTKETLSGLEETISSLYQKLSYETIPNAFETLGFDSVKTAGKNFICSERVNASIPADKRELGHKWLTEVANIPELIVPTVNAKQLSSFVKTYFETNAEWPPEDAMNVHLQRYIQVRKA